MSSQGNLSSPCPPEASDSLLTAEDIPNPLMDGIADSGLSAYRDRGKFVVNLMGLKSDFVIRIHREFFISKSRATPPQFYKRSQGRGQ